MLVAHKRLLMTVALAAALVAGCGGAEGEELPRSAASERLEAAGAIVAPCARLNVQTTGRIDDPTATELSGLVRSPTQPDVLWSHDDSGSQPMLYALGDDGHVLKRIAVSAARAIDWEDIAASTSVDGEPLLYLADIGDNGTQRATIDVYRVREPSLPGGSTMAPAERLRLRYPDGPHDAEALLVDPRGGELVVVTKQPHGARAYSASAALAAGSTVTLRAGPHIDLGLVTAGAVSADGRVVAVRSYTNVVAWRRGRGESLTAAMGRPPCRSPTLLLEGQGEALALDRHGTSFVTVTEGQGAALRRYAPAPP